MANRRNIQSTTSTITNYVKVLWLLTVLAPLHELFFGGATVRHIVEASSSSMGCPFKATRTFIGRHIRLDSFNMLLSDRITPKGLKFEHSEQARHSLDTRLFVATADEKDVVTSSNKKAKRTSPDALEVVVLGLSHHNAGVDVREKLAIPEADWNAAANGLTEYPSISGKLITFDSFTYLYVGVLLAPSPRVR